MKRSVMGSLVVALSIAAASGSIYGQEDTHGFVNDLTIAGLTEVQLGKMAIQKAADPDVKAFGQMMVEDHTKAGSELKKVAAELGVRQPTELDQKHKALAEKLSKLQGSAFDREYMAAMVQGHEEVLGKVRARVEHNLVPPPATAGSHPPASGATKSAPGAETGKPAGAGEKPSAHEHSPAAAAGSGEQKLTQWAAMALPTVQKHLERAREIQKKLAE